MIILLVYTFQFKSLGSVRFKFMFLFSLKFTQSDNKNIDNVSKKNIMQHCFQYKQEEIIRLWKFEITGINYILI